MKFSTQPFLLIAIFAFLFGSCSVEDHVTPSVYQNCRLSKVSRYVGARLLPDEDFKVGDRYYAANIYAAGHPFVVAELFIEDGRTYALGPQTYDLFYKYDASGRVLQIEDNNTSDQYRTYYEYLPDQIKARTASFKRDDWRTTLNLNSKGLVTNTGVEPGSFFNFSIPLYDEEGYVIEEMTTSEPVIKYTILNGNRVKAESTYNSSVVAYEYDLTRPNLPNPMPFFGKVSNNLLMKEIFADGNYEYKYTFDDSGRVKRRIKKVVSKEGESFIREVADYAYDCQ